MHHTSIRWMLHGLNTEGKKRIKIKWRCFCKQWTQLRMFCERAEEKVFTSAAVISIKQQNRNVTISHGNCQLGPNWISLILNRGEKYKSEHVQCFTVGPFVFTFQTTFNSFHTTRNTPLQYGLMLSFQASYLENIQCELGEASKKKLVFFRKTPKGGEGGLAESKISLSEKTEIFLEFFFERGGHPTYSKRVLRSQTVHTSRRASIFSVFPNLRSVFHRTVWSTTNSYNHLEMYI